MPVDLLASALTVFGVIFLFEIVDRTNFGVIGLSTKHPHKVVWLGAASAFIVSTVISVGLGELIFDYLFADLVYIKVVGGIILVAFGLRGLLSSQEAVAEKAEEEVEATLSPRQVWLTAFTLILFLEMGDNTQILTFEMLWGWGSLPPVPWPVVFVAASLALIVVAAIGATSGNFLKSRVPADKLNKLLSVVLVIVGCATILLALAPTLGLGGF